MLTFGALPYSPLTKVNDRDSAKMDEMKASGARGDGESDDHTDDGSPPIAPAVEVSTVSVGSMIRMATVDK